MKPHLVFQDSSPWIDYLPDTWAALRSDNWNHMPFDPKKIYKRFESYNFNSDQSEQFEEEIRIFNSLNYSLVYGHYFNCHPTEVFAFVQFDKANKNIPVVTKNFFNFWRPILGMHLFWANEHKFDLKNQEFFSPAGVKKFDDIEFIDDAKYPLNSLTLLDAKDRGTDPYHLKRHLMPTYGVEESYVEKEIDTYEGILYLTLKLRYFHQLIEVFPNLNSDDYAIARVDLHEYGTLGHFLITPQKHIAPNINRLSLAPVTFIPDTQVRGVAQKAFKLRNEL